jgi:methyl-accepting chemotaxis protein
VPAAEYPFVHPFFEAILAPGIKLASRLAMLWKIALVCVVLLVPTAVLGVGYWSGMTAQTSFAASEEAGVTYASPLIGLMASTVKLRSADVRLALGDRSQVAAATAARAGIAAQVRTLDDVVAQNPGGFGLAPEWRAARGAVTAFARRRAGASAITEVAAADASLTQINVMLTQLLNDSNLILDPDLDSYSVMDAWLLRVPVILDVATRASSQIVAGPAHGRRASLGLAVKLSAANTNLADSLTALEADIASVRSSTDDSSATAEISAPVTRLTHALTGLDRSLRAGTRGQPLPRSGVTAGESVATAAAAFNTSYPLVLRRIVSERAAGVNGQLDQSFVIAAICLLLAAYLVAAVTRMIVTGMRELTQAAEAIAHGHVDQSVGGRSRDEIGQVATAFETMVDYLKRLAAGAEHIARGDLATRIEPASDGDRLGNAFTEMTASLTGLIGQVQNASTTVSAASDQMAAASEDAGRALGGIASSIGDVAAGAERQVRMVDAARQSAQETASQVGEARRVALEGVAAAQQATHAMDAVRDSTGSVTNAIRELAEKTGQIGGIVETITSIASQTNLLALNAAIEAARAGEQGRGFAVVAEEVRKLAEESQLATTKISELIDDIQAETHRTVSAVEDGATKTQNSVAVVGEAREAFERIGSQVEQVTDRIVHIVDAVAEIATVGEQTSASSERVSASAQETSAATEETAASARALAATARELEALVATFKTAP